MDMENDVDLSIVVPVYNEEDVINIFLRAIFPILRDCVADYEIIFINDGSTDRTFDVLREACLEDHRIRVLDLSRNFGKEAALSAGLDFSRGRSVVPIDVDLQILRN